MQSLRNDSILWSCVMATLLAAGALSIAWAQETEAPVPTDAAPDGASTTQPVYPRRYGMDSSSPLFGTRWMTPEERAALEEFTRDNMKHLHQVLLDTPRGSRRRALLNFARVRMLNFERAQDDPDLAEKVAASIAAEDEIFKYAIDMQKAAPEQKTAMREKLRAKMRPLVIDLLDERANRIARLKARLEEEEKRLAQDRAAVDQVVERRVEIFLGEINTLRDSDRAESAGDDDAREPAGRQSDRSPPPLER